MTRQNANKDQVGVERLETLRAKLNDWAVEGVLIGSPANRRWLSGFTGSTGWLLVTREIALVATDSRYWEQAARQSPRFELFKVRVRMDDEWPRFLSAAGVTRVGIESSYVTLGEYEQLQAVANIVWTGLEETVEPIRAVKTPGEIVAIKEAAAITDRVMAQVNKIARPGMSERALAWNLEKTLRETGASGVAFPVIVASGSNGAMAHHEASDRQLRPGDALVIDIGAQLNGYHSDLTRSFYLGSKPSEEFSAVYEVVLRAQATALSAMRSGMTGKSIDSLARDVIRAAGFGESFGHSLGHGVGLEIHEDPRLSQLAEDGGVPAGAVVTVEPGVYLPKWGGVRIEDLVLVTDTGVEILSQCPKDPLIA